MKHAAKHGGAHPGWSPGSWCRTVSTAHGNVRYKYIVRGSAYRERVHGFGDCERRISVLVPQSGPYGIHTPPSHQQVQYQRRDT